MKSIPRAMMVLGLLLGSGISAMADVTWTLHNVTFQFGSIWTSISENVATGSFTTNDASNTYVSFSIDVTGQVPGAAFHATKMVGAYLPDKIGAANADFSEFIILQLAKPLTGAGGTIAITNGDIASGGYNGSYDCPGCGTIELNKNPYVTTEVPEASAITFLADGLIFVGIVGIVLRRKLIGAR